MFYDDDFDYDHSRYFLEDASTRISIWERDTPAPSVDPGLTPPGYMDRIGYGYPDDARSIAQKIDRYEREQRILLEQEREAARAAAAEAARARRARRKKAAAQSTSSVETSAQSVSSVETSTPTQAAPPSYLLPTPPPVPPTAEPVAVAVPYRPANPERQWRYTSAATLMRLQRTPRANHANHTPHTTIAYIVNPHQDLPIIYLCHIGQPQLHATTERPSGIGPDAVTRSVVNPHSPRAPPASIMRYTKHPLVGPCPGTRFIRNDAAICRAPAGRHTHSPSHSQRCIRTYKMIGAEDEADGSLP